MGKQLRDMLTDLRAEVGHSTNVAHGINDRDTLLYYLNRVQMNLYREHAWPQLLVNRDVRLAAGQRYCAYPSDLAFDDISRVTLFANGPLNDVIYGIGPEQMGALNSDTGQRSWPTARWMHNPDMGMFEVWPVPNDTGHALDPFLRLRGTRTVTKMVNDADESTLPDNLIVLYAASEILARDGAKDAQFKLNAANEAMRRHRLRQAHRTTVMAIGSGGGDAQGRGRGPTLGLDFIPPGYGSGPRF